MCRLVVTSLARSVLYCTNSKVRCESEQLMWRIKEDKWRSALQDVQGSCTTVYGRFTRCRERYKAQSRSRPLPVSNLTRSLVLKKKKEKRSRVTTIFFLFAWFGVLLKGLRGGGILRWKIIWRKWESSREKSKSKRKREKVHVLVLATLLFSVEE